MFKIFKTLVLVIWLIDIFDVNIIINGNKIMNAALLDSTMPLNFWFWFIFWLLVPGTETVTRQS